MTDDFHQLHEERLLDAVALTDELLDPDDDLQEIAAAYRDAHNCRDEALRRRTDQEAEAREKAAARIAQCYALLRTAGQQASEELSISTTDELRRTVLAEFSRRGGDAANDNP